MYWLYMFAFNRMCPPSPAARWFSSPIDFHDQRLSSWLPKVGPRSRRPANLIIFLTGCKGPQNVIEGSVDLRQLKWWLLTDAICHKCQNTLLCSFPHISDRRAKYGSLSLIFGGYILFQLFKRLFWILKMLKHKI